MQFTYKITSAKTVRIQIDRTHQITIGFDVFLAEDGVEEPTLYGSYSHGFHVLTTAEEIQESLEKFCATLASDATKQNEDAELNAQLAHAEEVQRALLNDSEINT